MIQKVFLKVKEMREALSKKERLFLVFAMLSCFCISAEYAIVRPVSSSLLISNYSSSILPYAWLLTVPLNFLLVFLYNRYLPKTGILPMFFLISSAVVAGSVSMALIGSQISLLSFLFYLWKEVYILLMFQQLWSMIHTTIATEKAKYLYGVLFGVGGIGGILGSFVPGFFAVSFGSESLLYLTIPLYIVLGFAFVLAYKESALVSKNLEPKRDLSTKTLFEGFTLISRSKVLIYILCTVFFMQLASALTELQFTSFLEKTVMGKDLRTQYCGKIMGIANVATTFLQFVGTFLILHVLGLKKSHFAVPLFLGCNALGVLFFPVFGMVSYSYIMCKAVDFSLFGVIREMLYIPLSTDEKFRAKAVIDVFVHRSSKAFASFFVFFVQFFITSSLFPYLSTAVVFLFLGWLFLVFRMSQKEQIFVV